ncbi:MAG: FliH/SctL family protein [Novosphingobium sp.]|uniref:FliH/SctL family protein n=1 Tax=Novosphingobium sp. TaxID=1874826 RepID=UPI0032BEAA41
MSSLPIAALEQGSGFLPDPRFCPNHSERQAALPVDPVAQAWDDGYGAGQAEANAAAVAAAHDSAAAHSAITLALARLDSQLAEELRQKLFVTVEALCEAAIAPLALDKAALAARVQRAAAMLSRADDERVLRLHPDDLDLVAKQLPADLEVLADPALERGALRVESANGGIEDGPAHWRRAIAEALEQC